ncbi:hypothetical protein Leryth_008625 [Lithospermum erythrorhizon]|nr:hypothetical protein Leryth_008625 [Lithospermum erythrorhizon]
MAQIIPEVPTDILIDILSRIPPKSLLPFRSVCYAWRLLIDSNEFINIHLKKSQETNSNSSIILAGLGIYVIDLDTKDEYVALELTPPVKFFEISSSINGLFLVMSDKNDSPLIWNPSTGELVAIPSSPVEYPHGTLPGSAYETYGFGFDSKNDEFKVVKSVKCKGYDYNWMNCETKVFSLKSNSWKNIDDFAYPLPHKRIWGVYVEGALHCHFVMPELIIIMAFNIGTETHYIVPSPNFPEGEERSETSTLAEIGGCLSLVNPMNKFSVDVWVMKEYGVEKSWTKLFNVCPSLIDCNANLYPLGYSKCGREVLLNCDDTKLFWYDLERESVVSVRVHNMPYVFYAMPFVA